MNSEFTPLSPDSPLPQKSRAQRAWDLLTAPSNAVTEIGEQRSARLGAFFLFVIFFFAITGTLVRYLIRGTWIPEMVLAFVISGIAYMVVRTMWYRYGIFLFSFCFNLLAYIMILNQGAQADRAGLVLIFVPLGLIIASFFLSSWVVIALACLNIAAYIATQIYVGTGSPVDILAQLAIIAIIAIVLATLTFTRNSIEEARLKEVRKINRELETLSKELERRVEMRTHELKDTSEQNVRRADQLTTISELARSITGYQSQKYLLPAITDFVSQRLGLYHVGIFLNDEDGVFAVLQAANSEGGKKMLARGHSLRIGEEGIVGYSINSGQPRIAHDVGADSAYFDNPDLKETRSEIALPLSLGSEVIGALDIQSTETHAFSREDLAVYTTLADQVAIAIQNSRLLNQAQSALRDIEAAYTQQTRLAWRDYSKRKPVSGYYFDGMEAKPLENGGDTTIKSEGGLTVPMQLRGQTIGKLKFLTANKNRDWSDEELALAVAALERAALAIENARLIEEAQRRALKERIISEGSTRVSAALNIEDILQTTAEELERALGSTEVVIQLEEE